MARIISSVGLMVLLLATDVVGQEPTTTKAASRRSATARQSEPGTWHAAGTRGAVAAGGQGAVNAGIRILKDGGNAADGAAATILALTVTDATAFCFGGEVPILVYDAKRNVVEVIAGQGVAPRLATREYFEEKEGIPARGIEPAAVPATLDAVVVLLDRHGTKTFADVAQPMLELLERGEKEWHPDLAQTIRRLIEAEKGSGGHRQRGLRLVADYFYRGPIARELDGWCRENGGLIRYVDLATHVTRVEEPVAAGYRGHTVYKCGAWTQGPYLLQTLQLLEGFDLRAMKHNSADSIHITAEAMKLALADRDVFYADPLFATVPLDRLLSREYVELRRPLIDRSHASLEQRPGDPRAMKPLLDASKIRAGTSGPSNDTTTCLVADGTGNVIAATPSGWSGVVAGKTGVWLGSRLQSFNIWKDSPNVIEPGKRPRITLTPSLVFKDGKPVLAVSVAGGDEQDQTSLQLILNHIDFGLPPAESVTAPRFGTSHHLGSFRQTPPVIGDLHMNLDVGESTIEALKSRGHKVVTKAPSSAPCVIAIDAKSAKLDAAGDPKARRHAAAF
jgi:gamma-glutamyltranspeptidase/glutathione hydrolase